YYLLVLGLAPVVAIALWIVFYRTRWGMLIRAATVDREMLGALGVDGAPLYTQVFIFGSGLAGLGGALSAPTVAVALGMDGDVLTTAFVVVVIGGVGGFSGGLLRAPPGGFVQAFRRPVFPGHLHRAALRHHGRGADRAAVGPAGPAGALTVRPAAWLGVLVVVLVVAPLALPPFFLQLLTEIAIVGLFATAFNLLMGFGGMVSFGHAA